MNRHLIAAALALTACSLAHADAGTELAALKTECAARHDSAKDLTVADANANEYRFVYAKGEYKGEAHAGQILPCTEKQFVAYLDSVDPSRVMAAYPTAAGRPVAKKADKK